MAISVDTVYQRVLALANKEQRGYITPQEFNLLAGQAQMEIFEQYFYDQKSEDKNLKNSTEFSNVDEMLDEKIAVFKKQGPIVMGGFTGTLPSNLYRLGLVLSFGPISSSSISTSALASVEVEQVTEEEAVYLNRSPISRPTINFPAFVRSSNNTITTFPNLTTAACHYIAMPSTPNWGYQVINEKALYDAGVSNNFELHASDSAELVYKILSLAGIVIAKPGLGTYADGKITTTNTKEKQ